MHFRQQQILWLVILCAVLYVPGAFSLPPLDRDEARFVQATKQMHESGDYWHPYFQETPRHKKPIGIYWLQAASVELLAGGDVTQLWAYRVVSISGMTLAVLLVWALARRLANPAVALQAAALWAVTLLAVVEAHIAKTDAMLLAVVLGSQWALWEIYSANKQQRLPARGWALLFWVLAGIGFLIKGPVALFINLCTIISLSLWEKRWRLWRGLYPLPGLALAAAMVAPWFISINSAYDGGFMRESLQHDFIGKLLAGQESHGAPFGYYLLLLPVLFWPSVVLLPLALANWQDKTAPALRFLLCWLVPAWLVFEIVPTKLPHYVLPLLPALLLLIARGMTLPPTTGRASRWLAIYSRGFTVLLALALPCLAAYFLITYASPPSSLAWALVALLTVASVLCASSVWRQPLTAALLPKILPAAVVVYLVVLVGILPQAHGFWLSRSLQQQLPTAPENIILVGYHEPSAVFLLGTKIHLLNAPAAAALWQRETAMVAAVNRDQRAEFLATLQQPALTPSHSIAGFNYSKGDAVILDIFTHDKKVP